MVRIQKQAPHRSNIQIYRYIKGDLLIHSPCTTLTLYSRQAGKKWEQEGVAKLENGGC